jgi:hypothetical protein
MSRVANLTQWRMVLMFHVEHWERMCIAREGMPSRFFFEVLKVIRSTCLAQRMARATEAL